MEPAGGRGCGDRELVSGSFRRYTTDELVDSRPDAQAREASRVPLIVLLDDIRSAHNVGLLFRLCDCVNVEALWLGGITAYPGVSEHASNRIAKTGVGGSVDVLPWRHLEDPVPEVRRLRDEGWTIAVMEQGRGTTSWRRAAYGERTVLVLGHERRGVRQELLDLADVVVELPVRGITNSLNVATCASVVLYEILGRWLEADGG